MNRITVTEFDRRMSEIFNRVAYQGESFLIERGGKPIARLEPPGPARRATFGEVLARLGDLHPPEGLADDLEAVRASMPKLEPPRWD
jgi:antitoxin (DNA-binding transcriptional repressor) of toxin-antitoxin stability system